MDLERRRGRTRLDTVWEPLAHFKLRKDLRKDWMRCEPGNRVLGVLSHRAPKMHTKTCNHHISSSLSIFNFELDMFYVIPDITLCNYRARDRHKQDTGFFLLFMSVFLCLSIHLLDISCLYLLFLGDDCSTSYRHS